MGRELHTKSGHWVKVYDRIADTGYVFVHVEGVSQWAHLFLTDGERRELIEALEEM